LSAGSGVTIEDVRRVAELIESNLEIIRANQRNHEIQFHRIAQVQAELDTIKARSEVVTKLRDIYRTTAITLNMYGTKLGNGPCEALFDLATSEEDFVRCAHPTPDAPPAA